MELPFTATHFFEVFVAYNEAVWPLQVLLEALALAAVACVFLPFLWADEAVASVLGALWAWLALVYHFAFFSRINPLAYLFAVVSMAGALAFFWYGVVRRRLRFAWRMDLRGGVGALLVVFALVVYPLWSHYAGHRYPAMPTFGLPCPAALFTIGLMAFAVPPYPRSPLLVPVLWCGVGSQAAFLLGVTQDLALIPAGIAGVAFLAGSRAPVAQVQT